MIKKIDQTKVTHVNYPDRDLLEQIQVDLQSYYERRISKVRAAEISGHIAKNTISFLKDIHDDFNDNEYHQISIDIFNERVLLELHKQLMFDLEKDESKLNSRY